MAFNTTLSINLAPGHRLQWEEAQNAYVILYPEGMVELNQTSAEILKLCTGELCFDEIVARLEQLFNVQNITDDVHEFIQVAFDNGWIKQT
ncbi:MAG TPA: pyrroloquinoline quinone biosynthesis peptide chaperone PqqD [Crenotrichaceae bacterium]|nr:pyrroloquinoline quinone biosynthesis peptide chaperone PqqD [Crenotrichaceae bacterium]